MLGFYRIRSAKARLDLLDLPQYFHQRHRLAEARSVNMRGFVTGRNSQICRYEH
jgi:hypothetical protein